MNSESSLSMETKRRQRTGLGRRVEEGDNSIEAGEGGVPWLLWKQHDGGEQRWELRRRGGGGKGETNSAIKIASYL